MDCDIGYTKKLFTKQITKKGLHPLLFFCFLFFAFCFLCFVFYSISNTMQLCNIYTKRDQSIPLMDCEHNFSKVYLYMKGDWGKRYG